MHPKHEYILSLLNVILVTLLESVFVDVMLGIEENESSMV